MSGSNQKYSNKLNIKAAIFDVDGTLLDSMPIWHDLGIRYLQSINITPRPGLSEVLFPLTFEEGIDYLKTEYNLPDSADNIRNGIYSDIGNFYRNEADLKPGMLDIVEDYHTQGIPMAIATSGDLDLIEAALKRHRIWDYFSKIITADELHTTKHEPFIYLKTAEYLGTEPNETAVYEDLLYALQSAKKAGFYCIGVYDKDSQSYWTDICRIADKVIH